MIISNDNHINSFSLMVSMVINSNLSLISQSVSRNMDLRDDLKTKDPFFPHSTQQSVSLYTAAPSLDWWGTI